MKKLSLFNKVMFVLNSIVAFLTVLAFFLPFLAPKFFPFLSVLTLFLPMILFINLMFLAYWGIQLKRQVLLSFLILLIGLPFINKFYKFSAPDYVKEDGDFTVMSYNVRLFNRFEWSEKKTIPIEISDFVKEKNPSILCIQEYSERGGFDNRHFKYQFVNSASGGKIKTGQAIFSQYPIISKGVIDFPKSSNSAIYADVVKGKDTIRIYNIHLQSIQISPDVQKISDNIDDLDEQRSEVMFKRLGRGFSKQQLQAELVMEHKKNCHYPIIICADMNNSAFSYVYRMIKGEQNDAFVEAGEGFGKSYDFKYYPARIDYILPDKKYEVKYFRNFPEIVDSDHFPVLAILSEKKP